MLQRPSKLSKLSPNPNSGPLPSKLEFGMTTSEALLSVGDLLLGLLAGTKAGYLHSTISASSQQGWSTWGDSQ